MKRAGLTFAILVVLLLPGCRFEPAAAHYSPQQIAQANGATALMGRYQYADAVNVLTKLHQALPQDPTVSLNLAIATLNRQRDGDVASALVLVKAVISAEPNNARAYYLSGLLHLYQGQAMAAAQALRKTLAQVPDDAYVHYFLAQALQQQGEHRSALVQYRQAISRNPFLRSARYGAAMSARRLGNKQEARKQLNDYRELAHNPRGVLAEFKYTRMGTLAEVIPLSQGHDKKLKMLVARPVGVAPKWLGATVVTLPGDELMLSSVAQLSASQMLVFGSRKQAGNYQLIVLNQIPRGIGPHPVQVIAKLAARPRALATADLNNDGLIDVVVCSADGLRVFLAQKTGAVAGTAGVKSYLKLAGPWESGPTQCRQVRAFDADHDGDLDVVALFGKRQLLLFNNDDLHHFRTLDVFHFPPSMHRIVQFQAVDWDHDRDLDLLILDGAGQLRVQNNGLLWHYQLDAKAVALPQVQRFALADLYGQGRWNLVTLDLTGQLAVWTQGAKGHFTAEKLLSNLAADTQIVIADLAGDFAPDILASGGHGIKLVVPGSGRVTTLETAAVSGLVWWINTATGGPQFMFRAAAGADSSRRAGRPTQWQIISGSNRPGTYANLYPRGGNDRSSGMRSNRFAVGTELRVRMADRWSILSPLAQSSSSSQSLRPASIGMGGAAELDYVELRWPDGVYQTERNIGPGSHVLNETQRQLSSCPVVFVKYQGHYRFASDVLGVGGLGFMVSPGSYETPRPWEFFRLPAALTDAAARRVELKITELMEENTYLDQLRLHRYTLPKGWQMVMDERMGVTKPFPTGKPVFFRQAFLPQHAERVAATSEFERRAQAAAVFPSQRRTDATHAPIDVLASISARDGRAVVLGAVDKRFLGRLRAADMLQLSFAPLATGLSRANSTARWGLVIDGWVEYPYSQTVFAAWQASQHYRAPSIDIQVNGHWQIWRRRLGYPAGMPRQSYFPLGKLPPGTTAIRIRSNLEIYWDRIRLIKQAVPKSVEHDIARLSSASLEFLGFPQRHLAAFKRPTFDYQQRKTFADIKALAGMNTRYGNILPLLQHNDDAQVIFGSGDAVSATFELPKRRTAGTVVLVLELRGFAKDMDLYTQHGGTVTPLPVQFPGRSSALLLNRKYNTRMREHW